jgi:signal transduction histidine kinase
MLLNEEVGTLNKIQKNYLENIYNSNKRMIGLIGDLLNVSHIELGSFPIRVEKVNLQTVSEIILKELNPQIEAKKIKVSKEYQSGLPELNADYKLIYIILQNLLSNAVVYTPVGGTVMLRIGLDNKVASQAFLITVADTGIGIPEAQKNKIFGKMFRADNAIEMSADGTGLGLYIVKSILDQTGGTVWFSSGGELSKNLGTSFYITLPLEGMKQRKGDKNLK